MKEAPEQPLAQLGAGLGTERCWDGALGSLQGLELLGRAEVWEGTSGCLKLHSEMALKFLSNLQLEVQRGGEMYFHWDIKLIGRQQILNLQFSSSTCCAQGSKLRDSTPALQGNPGSDQA